MARLYDFKISEDLSYIGKEFSIAHRSAFSEKKKMDSSQSGRKWYLESHQLINHYSLMLNRYIIPVGCLTCYVSINRDRPTS